LERTRIFDFPSKYEVTRVTVYARRQYHFLDTVRNWYSILSLLLACAYGMG